MARALAAGGSYGDIAAALDLEYDAARMRARRAGLRSLNHGRKPNPETAGRIATARRMLAEGCEHGAVAERLGMSPAAVRMMLLRARRASSAC